MLTMNNSRDIKHTIRINNSLQRIKEDNPDLRISQILSNAIRSHGFSDNSFFYIEDDKLADMLEDM